MTQLYDAQGQRKYLTELELKAFLKKADETASENLRLLCHVLAWTGCRLSEALALTPESIDTQAGFLIVESLKKRRRGLYRAVPISDGLIADLRRYSAVLEPDSRLWPMARNTAWGKIKEIMLNAGVGEAQAYPRALRHSFGVMAVQRDIPLSQIQKWLGHSSLKITAIYADAVGIEEMRLASRLWLKE